MKTSKVPNAKISGIYLLPFDYNLSVATKFTNSITIILYSFLKTVLMSKYTPFPKQNKFMF